MAPEGGTFGYAADELDLSATIYDHRLCLEPLIWKAASRSILNYLGLPRLLGQ
jgi:hypothetical protein